MEKLLQLGVLLIVLLLSITCIREPITLARLIVWWSKLVSHKYILSREAREAIDMMENDPSTYEKKYAQQLSVIRLTGWVGLFVSLIGSCLVTIGK